MLVAPHKTRRYHMVTTSKKTTAVKSASKPTKAAAKAPATPVKTASVKKVVKTAAPAKKASAAPKKTAPKAPKKV